MPYRRRTSYRSGRRGARVQPRWIRGYSKKTGQGANDFVQAFDLLRGDGITRVANRLGPDGVPLASPEQEFAPQGSVILRCVLTTAVRLPDYPDPAQIPRMGLVVFDALTSVPDPDAHANSLPWMTWTYIGASPSLSYPHPATPQPVTIVDHYDIRVKRKLRDMGDTLMLCFRATSGHLATDISVSSSVLLGLH